MIPNYSVTMNFGLGEVIDELRRQVSRFASDHITPIAEEIDVTNENDKYRVKRV